MNTAFILMAQYNAMAIIPVEKVCEDYFSHLTPELFIRKCATGEIKLPLTRIDAGSKKTAKGIHIADLAKYIDDRRAAAIKELEQLTGISWKQKQ